MRGRPAAAPAVPKRAVRAPAVVDDGVPERRRLHGPVEDQALYTCHCGFVFEAPVSTSVACPHCGDGQAW